MSLDEKDLLRQPSSHIESKLSRFKKGYLAGIALLADPLGAIYSFKKKRPNTLGGTGLSDILTEYSHEFLPEEYENESSGQYLPGLVLGMLSGIAAQVASFGVINMVTTAVNIQHNRNPVRALPAPKEPLPLKAPSDSSYK